MGQTHRDHISMGGAATFLHFCFPVNNFWRDGLISYKVYRRVKHVKYRSNWNLETICKILTELWPFRYLDFASFLLSDKKTFEGMHQFHSKFTKGLSIVEYRECLNLEIIG